MRKIVFKVFVDYEKEEKWLNYMAEQGWNLVKYTFLTYVFEACERGEYLYHIELLENLPGHPESVKYISFLENTGIEYVGAYMRWVYFRKKAVEGPFDIYTDFDSKIKHHKRIATLWGILGGMNLVFAMNNIISYMNLHFFAMNLYVGILGLVVGGLLCGLTLRTIRRMNKLKREKMLREY